MKIHSWEIIDSDVVIKRCDKSIFIYKGSTLPHETLKFWDSENLGRGMRREIVIIYRNISYSAYITREKEYSGRSRLFWHSDLSKQFENYKKLFDKNEKLELRFEKISKCNYICNFISETMIEKDVEREENIDFQIEDIYQIEGKKIEYISSKYERSSSNRKAAIKAHGLTCQICGFNFEDYYGERGKDFIEVHHVKPLYSLVEEIEVDPINDLVCVCSNCHRMIHRKKNSTLSIEEMKKIIKK